MKKIFSFFAVMAMMSMVLVACNSKSDKDDKDNKVDKSELAKMAKEANENCPISMGLMGEITSIEFDGTDLVYIAMVDEEWVNLDVMADNKEAAKQGMLQFFTTPNKDVEKMLKELEKTDAGVKYVYTGKTSGKKVEIKLSVKEIKEAKENPMSPEELIVQDVRVTNEQCPMEVDEGMAVTEIRIEGSDVVYICQVDETLFNIDDFEANREECQAAMEEYMADLAIDPAGKAFLDHCKSAGKAIVYRYQGATTGKVSDFRILL